MTRTEVARIINRAIWGRTEASTNVTPRSNKRSVARTSGSACCGQARACTRCTQRTTHFFRSLDRLAVWRTKFAVHDPQRIAIHVGAARKGLRSFARAVPSDPFATFGSQHSRGRSRMRTSAKVSARGRARTNGFNRTMRCNCRSGVRVRMESLAFDTDSSPGTTCAKRDAWICVSPSAVAISSIAQESASIIIFR